jgi:hypothetical protein
MQSIHRLQIFADGGNQEVAFKKSAPSASSADQKKALSPSPAWFFISVALCLCVRNFNSRQRAEITEGEKLLISFLFIL